MNYNLDIEKISTNLLPPDKRKANTTIILKALLDGLKWAHESIFGAYYDDLKERIHFNGNRLILEYALNKNFHTTFRQPNNQSDIYIGDPLPSVVDGFLVGMTEPFSSPIGATDAVGIYIGSNWTFVYLNHFKIYVPSAVLATYPEPVIRGFVDKYIPASIKYTLQSY